MPSPCSTAKSTSYPVATLGELRGVPNLFDLDAQSVDLPYKAVCAITGHPFGGKIYVTLAPDLFCVEYGSAETFVRTLEDREVTHEEITRLVFEAFRKLLPKFLEVVVTAESAAHPEASCRITQNFEPEVNTDASQSPAC